MKRLDFNNDQIKRINKLYHDFESDIYSEHHPEMLREEGKWEIIGKKYFTQEKQITVLDIGTGNGFVPNIIGKYLKESDTLICSDISEKMLEKAKIKLSCYNKFKKIFINDDALGISKMNTEINIITMNSVLHHLPDYEEVLENFSKLLKENGLFIIVHERNQEFCRNVPFLMKLCVILIEINKLLRRVAKKSLLFLGLYKRETVFVWDQLYSQVKKAIKEEGICDQILSIKEINALVDVHDPDEGGDGFDPFVVHQRFFSDFEIVELFTDMHLGPWTSTDNYFNKKLSQFLKYKFPYSGAVFGLIMRKCRGVS